MLARPGSPLCGARRRAAGAECAPHRSDSRRCSHRSAGGIACIQRAPLAPVPRGGTALLGARRASRYRGAADRLREDPARDRGGSAARLSGSLPGSDAGAGGSVAREPRASWRALSRLPWRRAAGAAAAHRRHFREWLAVDGSDRRSFRPAGGRRGASLRSRSPGRSARDGGGACPAGAYRHTVGGRGGRDLGRADRSRRVSARDPRSGRQLPGAFRYHDDQSRSRGQERALWCGSQAPTRSFGAHWCTAGRWEG